MCPERGGLGAGEHPLGPFCLARAGAHLPFERDMVVTDATPHLQHGGPVTVTECSALQRDVG